VTTVSRSKILRYSCGLCFAQKSAGKTRDSSSEICVLQGLSFAKAQLFPAHVSENLPKLDDVNNSSNGGHVNSESKMDRLVKIDPFRGSWGLRILELELSNPTDVVFEINVSVKL